MAGGEHDYKLGRNRPPGCRSACLCREGHRMTSLASRRPRAPPPADIS